MSDRYSRREKIARRVHSILASEGLKLTSARYSKALRNNDREGARIFEEEVVSREGYDEVNSRIAGMKAISISTLSVHRILGFGAWQTRVLGGEEMARAGALFNLGIVLFDALLDRGNETAKSHALSFTMPQLTSSDGPYEYAFFRTIARRFFELAGTHAPLTRLEALLASEKKSVGYTPHLRALRGKSVGPFQLMAALGSGDLAMARIFGRAVWIVDDLWDWDEDFESKTGRPWLRQGTEEEKLACECTCLARSLVAVRDWPPEARSCLATTLCAWIAMPRPQPLFAATMTPEIV